ncbi:MAG: tetratricopeptide repeat protein [Thermoanaerobaculia bacterium]
MSRASDYVSPLEQGVFLVHLNRARQHLRDERFDRARQELELAQLARPNDTDVLNLLSVIEFKRGYFHEAAQAARALLKGKPESAILHSNLGLILFKAGVLGDAEQELRRAIALQPDHLRSHLYLGLLYRMRGKLGLAVEHLRLAGAKRVVAEIEETLRGAEASASGAPAVTTSPAPLLRLAGGVSRAEQPALTTPAPFSVGAAPLSPPPSPETTGSIRVSVPPAEPTEQLQRETTPESKTASARLETEGRPLFHVRPDGGLEVASRGVVFVRKGSVVWYSGKIRFAAEPTFRGTRLEKILRADGRGYLFVNDPGRQAYRRDLAGQSLYLEGSRLLALDHGLSFRVEPIHGFRMNRRVDILKIQGRGSVILSVGGVLLAHEVSSEFPLSVSARDLVAWMGELVPSVLEDRFLEEVMMPDAGSAPKIRFEGQGTVLTEPPRPRRRASDLARRSEADRRA